MANITGGTFFLNPLALDYPIIQWIENVKSFCGEVILVDMGSTDGTRRAIRNRFGKSVAILSHRWKFSKDHHEGMPRNVIVGAASGDWIYLPDCDEIMPEWYFDKFHRLLDSDSTTHLYRLSVVRFFGSCYLRLIEPGFQRLIFRNRQGYYYGPVHDRKDKSGHTLLINTNGRVKIARQHHESKLIRHISLFDYGKCRHSRGIATSHNFFIKQARARLGDKTIELLDEKAFKLERPTADGRQYVKWTGRHPQVMQEWVRKHWRIHGWEV